MDELHNLAETGDGGFELSRTFEILQQEKKAQEKRRREAEAKRNRQLELLCAERRMLEERAEKLADRYRVQKEQIIHMQREQDMQARREQDEQSQRERDMQARREQDERSQRERDMHVRRERDEQLQREQGMQSRRMRREKTASFSVIAGLICCIFWLLLCLFMSFSRVVWLIGQAVLLVLIAAGILNGRREFNDAGRESREISAGKGCDAVGEKKNIREKADDSGSRKEETDLRAEISRCQAILEVLAEEQQENEIELENNRSAQREAAESCGQNDNWEQEIRAIALAEETLHSLAAGKGELSAHQLNEAVSVIFDQITDGKYGKIKLSEKYEPRIEEEFKMRKPEAFSAGTMQQAYFAYRMAAGQFLEQEEPLPFLLDEVFSMYDGKRLREVLRWLGRQRRQIFLFTCQEREADCLREMGIPFQKLTLTDEN